MKSLANHNLHANLTIPARKTGDINKDGKQGHYQEHEQHKQHHHQIREDQEEEIIAMQTSEIVIKQHDTILSPDSLCKHYSNKALPNCPTPPSNRKSGHYRSLSTSSSLSEPAWGEPPFDIQRPNCVPGFGPFDISTFKSDDEEDQMSVQSCLNNTFSTIDLEEENDFYDTKPSHTHSSSGDSGYGTRRKNRKRSSSIQPQSKVTTPNSNKVQNLFEALFAPVTTASSPPSLKIHPTSSKSTVSSTGTTSSRHSNKSPTKKLSLLFSKSRASHQQQNDDPHFVKYQTWSINNSNDSHKPSPSTSSSMRRPHEENLFKFKDIIEEETLPPTIKVQEPSQKRISLQQRARRRTDAALMRVKSEIMTTPSIVTTPISELPKSTHHSRCKSIGSLDLLSPNIPPSLISPTIEDRNILDHCDQDGNIIARYKLGNVIGKGHFGTVFRALDLISGKTVAVKQINLKDSRQADIEDMMQEASLLSSLTHGNIVKYEGFIQTLEHMNIVLEYVENGSLLHTLKHFGNALPEHLVASYCHDILQGLAYLHQQDVVHCDLKAANILTTKAGDVKLSDFGVSLNLKLKNHEENLVSGTPFWMSPEVIELKGASVQSDIWSLGCTVIELCTGKPPYADLLTMTAMFKIVEDDCPPLPENISDDLKDFLKLCFKKNPLERPKAIHLMHHPWVLQKERNVPPPTTPSSPTAASNNSTILQSYLKKSVKKEDNFIMLDTTNLRVPKRKTSSISLSSPKSTISSPLGHSHAMVKITFEEGSGPMCPICKQGTNDTASMCTSGCGLVCHPKCFEQNVLKAQGKCPECLIASRTSKNPALMDKCPHSFGASAAAYAPAPLPPAPKPTGSISTQLTSIFRKKESKKQNAFDNMRVINTRKMSQPSIVQTQLGSPTTPKHTSSKTWWKKKSQQ
ncbi:hypothetical protein [Parasitella parasitica]|uniref:Protein kinase domain-containing protein n=1 Tax=Parasitella parasitica TaxID=35722 RepID=A0A0B7NP48_9FUNG|nr:hypothetical protein [Parasitella parasitica]